MKYFFALVLLSIAPAAASAGDKSTSLSDARSAIEANLKTPQGKAFDQQAGKDFAQKHMAPLRACKTTSGNDMTSFWILLKLGKDGDVEEVLFYPTTKLATCAHGALMKERLLPPPRADYWISVYLKLSN